MSVISRPPQIKLISGDDIANKRINYIVRYKSITDSICQIFTEFFANYIDSLSLFTYYDSIQRKAIFIYPREPITRNVLIKSILLYPQRDELADTIFRYDKAGDLKEIYYPNGNRKLLKYWSDTLLTSDTKAIYFHTIFAENQYHYYKIFSKKNHALLEDGSTNISNDSTANTQKTIYIYDDSANLIYKNTLDEKNTLIQSEHFIYDSGKLIRQTVHHPPHDAEESEVRIYDRDGNLLELYQKDYGLPHSTWKWVYHYNKGLLYRTDVFRGGKLQSSTMAIYSLYK